MNKEKVINEIKEFYKTADQPDWDGYDAYAVTERHVEQAILFINSLPDDLEDPSIGGEPDGCITVEWYRDDNRQVISISVEPNGELIYACRLHGHMSMDGCKIPESLISLIRLNFGTLKLNNG